MKHSPRLAALGSKKGFTLVELLVVISIIAILAGLLLPALSRAKTKAVGVECLGNKRQLSIAWLMYADENEERFPSNSAEGGHGWIGGVMDFLGSNLDNTNTLLLSDARFATLSPYSQATKLFKCPSDRSTVPYNRTKLARTRSVSMNQMIAPAFTRGQSPANAGWRVYRKETDLTDPIPSGLWVFIDEHPDSIDDRSFSIDLSARGERAYYVSWPANFHNMGATVAFADGHAETPRWKDPSTYHDNLYCGCLSSYAKSSFFTVSPNNQDIAWLQERSAARQSGDR